MKANPARLHSQAWILLTAALAVHLADEFLTDVLSVYNPGLDLLRHRLGWRPLPRLDSGTFLLLMSSVLLGLAALTPWVRAGRRATPLLSDAYAGFMMGNALGHLFLSWRLSHPMPGVLSSPLLLAAAGFLSWAGLRRRRGTASGLAR